MKFRKIVTIAHRLKHLLLRPYESESAVSKPIGGADFKWFANRNREGTEQLRKINNRVWFFAVMLFLLGIALAGCAGRETQIFMQELQEVKAEVEAEQEQALKKAEESVTQVPEKPTEIYVDVCGAVVNPGVYVLEEGSRVFMAVEMAGGYLPEAAQGYVNRAELLFDGQQLYVPTAAEVEAQKLSAFSDGSDLAASGRTEDGKVNLNTADEETLMTLTGIGATRAKDIIAYREENGPFQAIEEIMNVQGIKEGTFAKIKDEIMTG